MKTYNKNSVVRKPMMYGGPTVRKTSTRQRTMQMGGMAMSAPMGMGMAEDTAKKNKKMVNMPMMYGGMSKKRKY